jgi:hypothetical protein
MKKIFTVKNHSYAQYIFNLWFEYRESWAWYRPVIGVVHHPSCTHALQHRLIELCFVSNRMKSLPIMSVCCWTSSVNLHCFYKVCIMDKMLRGMMYGMIYLLSAIGLPPGGSSTVHIYTQTIHKMTQNKQYVDQHKNLEECGLCPGLCRCICLITAEKARKNLSQDSRRVPAGTMKIHKHTIRIHRCNNKYT